MARIKKEKPKNIENSIFQLYQYIKPFIWLMLLSVFCSLISSILSLIMPSRLSNLIELIEAGLTGTMDFTKLSIICSGLLFLYLLSFIFGYLQGFISTTITEKLSKILRTDVNQKIHIIQLKYFDSHNVGDLLSRLINDISVVAQNLNNSITTLISAITLLFGSSIMMLITNWQLAIMAMLLSVIGVFLLGVIAKKSQKYYKENRKNLGALNGIIEEVYSGHKIVKTYNAEDYVMEEFEKINKALQKSSFIARCCSRMMNPLTTLVGNLSHILIAVVGAIFVYKGFINFGTIVAFIVYIKLFNQPLNSIAQVFSELQSILAAGERVFEFFNEEELENEEQKTITLKEIVGNVKFKDVSFGYNDNLVVKNFNLDIPSNSKVAIVGPTGAGKTTLVNLLMRFYEVNTGDILIDNISIKDITRENLHELFGMVLQDTWLFQGTLRENLIYTSENISDKQLDIVCSAVGLSEWINTLPKKYDTELSESVSLSEGQKQLITIARAMLKNAPLLILDEATSSIDTKTELLVQQAMDKLMQNKTSFIIAHRLSTIRNADIIIVLKDGKIIETGNHNELLKKNGFYAELYNSQFDI